MPAKTRQSGRSSRANPRTSLNDESNTVQDNKTNSKIPELSTDEATNKKRLISERSPAVKPRKKGQVLEKGNNVDESSANNMKNVNGEENKENTIHENEDMTYSTPPRPTPYWKVAQERGTSPRVTRSASARKRMSNIPRFTPDRSESANRNLSGQGEGLFPMEFSPPNQKKNNLKEKQLEEERLRRRESQRIEEGDVVYMAKATDDNEQKGMGAAISSSSPSSSKKETTPIRETLNLSLTKVKDERVKALEMMVDTVEKENVKLRDEIAILKRDLECASEEKTYLVAKIARFESKLEAAENESETSSKIENLHEAFQEFKDKLDSNKSRDENNEMKRLQDENLSLKEKIAELDANYFKSVEQVGAFNDKMIAKESAHEATVNNLQSTLQLAQEELHACKDQFMTNERAHEEATREADSIIKHLKDTLHHTQEQLSDSNAKMLTSEKAHEVALQNAQTKIEVAESSLRHTQDQLKDREESKVEVETSLNLLREKESTYLSEIQNLNTLLEGERAKADQRSDLDEITRKEVEACKSENSRLQHELSQSHQQSIAAMSKEYENSIDLLKRHNEGQIRKVMDKMREEHDKCVHIVAEKDKVLTKKDSEMDHLMQQFQRMKTSIETFDVREQSLLQQLDIQDSVRRKLHNRVLQLSGNIKVFVRVRPTLTNEVAESGECPLTFPSSEEDVRNEHVVIAQQPYVDRGGLSSRRKKWRFAFDTVLEPEHDQNDVWTSVQPFVQSAIDGYNVCLFAYGQTGSGKTFTMLGNQHQPGIMTRVIKNVFEYKQLIEESSKGEKLVDIKVELLEVYNESVRDLLSDNVNEVSISMNASCPSTSNILFSTPDEESVYSIVDKAQKRRCVKATKSNKESSRSHLIFTIHIHLHSNGVSRKGKLHICDLAGSERLDKSESVGSTLKETQHINKSLSTLSNVVEKLQSESKHVPYRDSKLTYLLRDSLGGDSKTLAIVCCNPVESHFQETLCSLRFASKVNRVELKSEKNFSC